MLRLSAVVCVMSIATGCASTDASKSPEVVGTYTLVSLNGTPVPANRLGRITVDSGRVVLSKPGRFEMIVFSTTCVAGTCRAGAHEKLGSWSGGEGNVRIQIPPEKEGWPWAAEVQGTTIKVQMHRRDPFGITYVFERMPLSSGPDAHVR